MKSFFDDYKDDFLQPSEKNFSQLLEKMEFIHNSVLEQTAEGVPRIPLQKRFSYDDRKFEAPSMGKSSSVVLGELAKAFQGSVRWNQPSALINITPNPLLDSIAAANIASVYNINCLWDYMSGGMTLLEKNVIDFLCHIAGWDSRKADGFSTFGGKATLMYAIRCGLNVCDRDSVENGLKKDYVVLASKGSHYSIEDACNYLGIGRNNVIRIAQDSSGAMDPVAFEKTMRLCLDQKKRIAAIILLGGDTIHYTVDPIKSIYDIRDKLVEEYALPYKPYMHLDSVLGWIGLVFRAYNFKRNIHGIESDPLTKIRALSDKLSDVKYVDSFSADFHKTGLSPYNSSYFVSKLAVHIHSINKSELHYKPNSIYGEVHTHQISFENSRPANGIVSAWTSIQRLGIDGYQRYWAQLISTSLYIAETLEKKCSQEVEVLNKGTYGHAIVIQLKPPGIDLPYKKLPKDKEQFNHYVNYTFSLYDYMAYELLKSRRPYPLLGFIPDYKSQISNVKCPVFLIYSNHPHFKPEDCDGMIQDILDMKHMFESTWKNKSGSLMKHATSLKFPR